MVQWHGRTRELKMVQHTSDVAVESAEVGSESNCSKAIPLPAPLPPLTNGNAYGGNQSFVQSSVDSIVNSLITNGGTSYWDNNRDGNSDTERVPGVVGLTNIGNTCFMNSGLQCLLNTPSISEFFIKASPFVADTSSSDQFALLNQFQIVVREAWYGQNTKINLQDFKSCLANIHSQFNDSRQHDCQEFLALLLDSLHEQLKKWSELTKGMEIAQNFKKTNSISSSSLPTGSPDLGDGTFMNEKQIGSSVEEKQPTLHASTCVKACDSAGQRRNMPDSDSENVRPSEVSSYERPLKVAVHIRSPSKLKSKLPTKKYCPSLEVKAKYQNKKLKGAQTSLSLPNFGPTNRNVANWNCASSPASLDRKKREIKIPNQNGKFGLSRHRKKPKLEVEDSPEACKRTKVDVPLHKLSLESPRSGTDIKRKLNFPDFNPTSPVTCSKTARVQSEPGTTVRGSTSYTMNEASGWNPDEQISNYSSLRENRSGLQTEAAARAEEFWDKHIEANNTVIAKTYQGLLKSTVVCATCNYNSVTYEPFMYLTLPFPRVLERQLTINFVSMKDRRPKRIEVNVGVMDTVLRVKDLAMKQLGDFSCGHNSDQLILAEVYNYNVQTFWDNSAVVRKLNDNHNLYLFELNENFDKKYNFKLNGDETEAFSFGNPFGEAESTGAVTSTSGSQMNATTYLDDWDQAKCTSEADALPKERSASGTPFLNDYLSNVFDQNGASRQHAPSCDVDITSTTSAYCMDTADGIESDMLGMRCTNLETDSKNSHFSKTRGSAPVWAGEGSSETEDSGVGSGSNDSNESGSVEGSVIGSKDLNFNENESVSASPNTFLENDEVKADLPDNCIETGNADESDSSVPDLLSESDMRSQTEGAYLKSPSEIYQNHSVRSSEPQNWQNKENIPLLSDLDSRLGDNDEQVIGITASSKSESATTSDEIQCIICLEDCPVKNLRQHKGCDCIICANCVQSSINHHFEATRPSNGPEYDLEPHDNKLKCATCMKVVDSSEFEDYNLLKERELSQVTPQLVSVVFRNDELRERNTSFGKVFGTPWLLKLPSSIPAQEFYDYIYQITPFPGSNYKILNVSSDGKNCAQCLYSSLCRGCEIPRSGLISFRSRSTIAMVFSGLTQEMMDAIDPGDMAIEENVHASSHWGTSHEPNYDIHDCLRAFSEKEHLDEQNPWYCPKCEKSRCATKALSVCHFPDFLIVYLKRFVFLDHSSNKLNNKLRFPVDNLDLSEYIAEEFSGRPWEYNLYGCICHFGSVSSGHYTAYGKNPLSNAWHYFNDDMVSSQCPKDLEHTSAYVLFYGKKGVKFDIPNTLQGQSLPGLLSMSSQAPPNISVLEAITWDSDSEKAVTSSSTELTHDPVLSVSPGDNAEKFRSVLQSKEDSEPRWDEDLEYSYSTL